MSKNERKKELLASYKERPVVGGVCAIICNANNRALVFSCRDPESQRNRFEFSVSTGGCSHIPLQGDWKAFGPGTFNFQLLETLEKKKDQTEDSFLEELELLREDCTASLAKKGFTFYQASRSS
ncbi:hypothetical protein SDC9_48262 [bioreactor metagenome]|uniref:GIY-YIG nuclease family protein n=1 Tax=bioreactor metagenome TaxID=1076179 RepID=A0A644WEQ4_9ZZZZ